MYSDPGEGCRRDAVVVGGIVAGHAAGRRVAGSDLVYDIAATAAERGRSIFLLGGNPADVCDRAVVRLKQLYPELEIAGAELHDLLDSWTTLPNGRSSAR